MDHNQLSEQSQRKLYINILVAIVFTVLMGTAITYLNDSDGDVHDAMMQGFAKQFERSINNTHWQWQAEGRPERILLVHYDQQGKEVGRRPVIMAHYGWPKVAPSGESCLDLWRHLLNTPARLDGFRVLADYYRGEEGRELRDAYCRFRLSNGPYFDYAVYTGLVTYKGEGR